jgi:hypothetical protein
VFHDRRAERLPQLLVPALRDQVQVQLAERRQEAVRVRHLDRVVGGVAHLKRVRGHGRQRQHTGEQPVAVVVQLRGHPVRDDRDRLRVRAQHAKAHAAGHRVRAQQPVRVVVLTAQQTPPVGVVERRSRWRPGRCAGAAAGRGRPGGVRGRSAARGHRISGRLLALFADRDGT